MCFFGKALPWRTIRQSWNEYSVSLGCGLSCSLFLVVSVLFYKLFVICLVSGIKKCDYKLIG